MGSTVASLLLGIRRLIPEASAVDWNDSPDLLYILNKVYKAWAADLGHLPGPGWFTMDVTFTIAANATTKDLTTLIDASTVGTFAALKSLFYVPTSGNEIEIDTAAPGQENLWRLPIGLSAVGQQAPDSKWLTRPAGVPTLNIGPESNALRTFRCLLRYEPPTVDEADSVQTDPRHDDVLIRGTVLRALEEVGETDNEIERRWLTDKSRFLDDERLAAGESQSETTKVVVSDAMFG